MKSNKHKAPPRWMVSFFVWCSKPADVDDLLGDMEEIYFANLKERSVSFANYKFLQHALGLLFSYTVKKRKRIKKSQHPRSLQNNTSMYFNYLKMVLRGLRKQLSFTILNVLGLGLGLSMAFMVLLYIQSELSYDRFHSDADRIFRVTKSYKVGEDLIETSRLRYYLIPPMKENIPSVEDYTSIKPIEEPLTFQYNEKEFDETRVALVDENFFNFFSFDLLTGNRKELLSEPSSIVISKSMAARYFTDEDPISQVIKISLKSNRDKYFQAKVTGIFEDMPHNSHFHLDFLLSKNTVESDARNLSLRGLPMQHNYIKLLPQQPITEVTSKLPYIEDNYAPSFYKTAGMHLDVQAMTDIHLRSNLEDEFEQNGNIEYVYLLSFVGIFILIIASFNYMNLSTSNALERAKEVGVRKVMGSKRSQLMIRFFTESISVAFIALLFSIGIIYLCLPYFNELSGKTLTFNLIEDYEVALAFLGITLLVGIVSGIYPALYLSKFNVIGSLKGTVSKHGKGTKLFRKSLVTSQFTISVVLILCTIIVFNQLGYLKSKNLGFSTEAIITVNSDLALISSNYEVVKQDLLARPNILAVAGANRELVTDFDLGATNGITMPGVEGQIGMNYAFVDEDFFDLYGITLASGDSFKDLGLNTSDKIILNQTAVEQLGSNPEEILGTNIHLYEGFDPQVIGVVEDFHFESLHKEIRGMYFQHLQSRNREQRLKSVSIKMTTENIGSTLGDIEDLFGKLFPDNIFDYEFLDDRIERAYETEKRFTVIFSLFSGLAIFMACLGVFGLSVQIAVTKQKEIGVRKVLGASTFEILRILTQELLLLVLLANVIAWPIAYSSMTRWLQDFPYREGIRIELFLPVLIASLAITIISLLWKGIQTALINPAHSLKAE